MRPFRRLTYVLVVNVIALSTVVTSRPALEAEETIAPEVFKRVVDVLSGRRVAREVDWATGTQTRAPSMLRQLFQQSVGAVPFVISPGGLGSAVVVAVNPAESLAWVITNHHVIEQPFHNEKGVPYVALIFYDPQLAAEPFDAQRFAKCVEASQQGDWCKVLLRSLRIGVVAGSDPDRDLALLRVIDPPWGIQPIQEVSIESVSAGDDVAVISHPRGLLWTLTTGIVSGVRLRYPMGKALGTIIQTQTPISPGSSGGPLLTPRGDLLGVISWGVFKEAQGLNAAIAINEVRAFANEQAKRFRQR